jgi:class 3 adenylate cyclase
MTHDQGALAHLRHELRTPLNHIIGYGEMLIEDSGRPELVPALQTILADAQLLLIGVNEYLSPSAGQGCTTDTAHLQAQLSPLLASILATCTALKHDSLAADDVRADIDRIAGATGHLSYLVCGGLAQRAAEHNAATPVPAMTEDRKVRTTGGGVILVVDDNDQNREMLGRRLSRAGYTVRCASGGAEALAALEAATADLVLLDVMMPDINGYEVLKRLKRTPRLHDIPVLMISSLEDTDIVARCIELGAEDYLPKPFSPVILRARVEACLEKKRLRDQEVRLAAQLAEWSRTLEQRVAEQVAQVERLGRLKRFFSPQLAELIVAGGTEDPLRTHRRQVTVVFLDLRGFTSFAESVEPEELMGVLREFHGAMGELILKHEGTLERFTGDGMMIFFNDPVEVADHAERAVRMAVEMRERVAVLVSKWKSRGWDLALGVGIAQGDATLGAIGFDGRWDYGAIGTVTNLAARLCSEAKAGQILLSSRMASLVEGLVEAEEVGSLMLRGLKKPVPAHNVTGLRRPGSRVRVY